MRAAPLLDPLRDVRRVTPRTLDEHRAGGRLEGETAEEQSRGALDDTAQLLAASRARRRPAGRSSRTPAGTRCTRRRSPRRRRDRRRAAVARPGHPPPAPCTPLDAAGEQVGALHPEGRSAVEPELVHLLAPHRRTPAEDVAEHEDDEREHDPEHRRAEAHRDLAGVAPAQDGGSALGELVGDVGAGVRAPRPPGRGRPGAGRAGGTRSSGAA